MSIESLKKIKSLYITVKRAKKEGVSARMLGHYVATKKLIRLSHGIYTFPENMRFDLEGLIIEKISVVPQGIVGLKTALRLYDLTEESPEEIDLIVPKTNVPKRKMKDVRLYQVKKELYDLETERYKKIKITPKSQSFQIKITKIERTIIDLLRTNEPISSVLNMIKEAQRKNIMISFSKLKELSEIFRVKAKVKKLLEALL